MMHHLPTYCSASEMYIVNRVRNCAEVISNALGCSIVDSDLKFMSRIRLHWMNMLYVHFSDG